jgi:hypothetical protein
MEHYDPLHAPDSSEWLELDEHERISLVLAYHKRMRVQLPNAMLHATIHTIVENQHAMGDETVVKDTLKRLQREGLDRHEAIHAVGSVLVAQMWEGLKGLQPKGNLGQSYEEALQHLTAESWRRSAREN